MASSRISLPRPARIALATGACLAWMALAARADMVALDDEQLSDVQGADMPDDGADIGTAQPRANFLHQPGIGLHSGR